MPWTANVNPVAGRGRTQKLLPELERAAKAAGIALHVSPEPGAPTKLARAAADEGHDLVGCGGDGLVTEVAGVAADAGCRLAIVPTGAGNDFARVLGYDPKHPLGAFDVLANGVGPEAMRIVTHHWSDNPLKGFDVYEQVDQLIADGKLPGFELWIIGRWPARIRWPRTS